jgi:hypothetical protein
MTEKSHDSLSPPPGLCLFCPSGGHKSFTISLFPQHAFELKEVKNGSFRMPNLGQSGRKTPPPVFLLVSKSPCAYKQKPLRLQAKGFALRSKNQNRN